MTPELRKIVGSIAIIAPGLHLISDLIEVVQGHFSDPQLFVNYLAFVGIPFIAGGLYAVQLPKIKWPGLIGAFVYGASFVYFAHTTLVALETSVLNYEILWTKLGSTYTVYGALMIAGGLMFAFASLKTGILSAKGVYLFVVGLLLNLAFAIIRVPDIFQTIGSSLRNVGLMWIGYTLLKGRSG